VKGVARRENFENRENFFFACAVPPERFHSAARQRAPLRAAQSKPAPVKKNSLFFSLKRARCGADPLFLDGNARIRARPRAQFRRRPAPARAPRERPNSADLGCRISRNS